MTPAQARASIERFAAGNRETHVAESTRAFLNGASNAVVFLCAGGHQLVTKGTKNGNGLIAEHVVGRLGQLLDAPVGDIHLVNIPDALRADARIQAMGPSPAHGVPFVEDLTDRSALSYFDVPENRLRFGRLCTLYSLAGASDHQLFYSTKEPRLVYSFDHGHFFPGGPGWTADTLKAAPAATIDGFFAGSNLTQTELVDGRNQLATITDADISNILAGIPPEWTFTDEERDALNGYLRSRRDTLLTLFPQA